MKFKKKIQNIIGRVRGDYRIKKISSDGFTGSDVSDLARLIQVKLEGKVKVHERVFMERCCVGRHSYITCDTRIINATIGKFCSIGQFVSIGLPRHPSRIFVSTHPAFFSCENKGCFESFQNKSVFDESVPKTTIGHDVWIGNNVLIPGGVDVGAGSIIGCGAVVVKDVPPYSIVAGNPARIVGHRFSSDKIDKLLELEWWTWPDSKIMENVDYFSDIDGFLEVFGKDQ